MIKAIELAMSKLPGDRDKMNQPIGAISAPRASTRHLGDSHATTR
jgi:hypothetical protein